jgi:hypothetical protein
MTTENTYNLTYLKGTKIKISLENPIQIGETKILRVLGTNILVNCTNQNEIVEISDSLLKPVLSLIVIVLALLAGLYYLSTVSIDTSENVLKAAKTIDPAPIVSKGKIEMLRCGTGDLYSFDVSDRSGKHLGCICAGNAFNSKGATARFD